MEPIFEAVLRGEGEVTRLLREDPAVVRTRAARDHLVEASPRWVYGGDTSLHLAAAGLWTGVARALLESQADPNAANRRGATPLDYACDPRPKSCGAWNPEAQSALIQRLVTHGAEIDRADRGGATPLHRAARARSVAAVRQLLEVGARTDGNESVAKALGRRDR
jgi:ankyrin repeat protein